MSDEILKEEELEKVVGGTYEELKQDADTFLRRYGISCEVEMSHYGIFLPDAGAVTRAFAKFGVTCKVHTTDFGGNIPNEYFLNGEAITREAAWKHVDEMYRKNNNRRKNVISA